MNGDADGGDSAGAGSGRALTSSTVFSTTAGVTRIVDVLIPATARAGLYRVTVTDSSVRPLEGSERGE